MCGTQSLRHLKTFTKVTSPLGSRAVMRWGSSPHARTTSEQAAYRLLRLFTKVRAHSFRCSSFPTAIRSAGFAVGF